MKLAIFGASGRTGRPLVQQALDAEHDVIALVRTPATFPLKHERLTVVQGDVLNPADVDKVVQGADTVLSVLGHSKNSPKDMQTVATKNILAAMETYGVPRLVILSGASVYVPQDQPKLINHVMKFVTKAIAGPVLADGEQCMNILQDSNLDWIIVRGPMLNEGPHTGKYRVGWTGVNTGIHISRADVADFMLKQVTDNTYIHQAPLVSN